jgi:glycosyltransferase involved in cell wall biosynthesis
MIRRRSKLDRELQVSVVIPLLNEEESLPALYKQLIANLSVYGDYEIIFVDDGSRDRSLDILQSYHENNPRVKIVSFRKNYGKSAALAVGFAHAGGTYVITMDADLQDDPAEIPRLISKLEEGYDLVSGWKKVRHDPIGKKLPSKVWNFVTGLLSGLRIHDFNCGLKGYRKDVVKHLHIYGELYRFIPALVHFDGFRVTEIPVKHHPRQFGKSKYGVSRFVSGFLDLITVLFLVRYTKKPMHLFGVAGMILLFLGLVVLGYLTWGWFQGIWIGDRPIFFLGILLMVFGAQSFSIGLLGDLITRAQSERQEYTIKLLAGLDQEQQ